MKTFALTRASDSAQAIATAAKATTAQQGAEIRFIGGGTTLIDLMKLNVEQPKTLIDINLITPTPSSSGMRRWSIVTSGRCRLQRSTASRPLLASATTIMSASNPINETTPWRRTLWSSAIRTPMRDFFGGPAAFRVFFAADVGFFPDF
jgi:hypothetical protein